MNTDKEFVPYQPSLDMKEIGFDEPCFGLYHNDKTFYPTQCKSHEQFHGQICSAPLRQQSFRFFREKYGLEGVTQRAEDFMWYKWTIHQYNENSKKYVANWYKYKTYEEAELACLIKLIEIVKNK